MYLYQIIKGDDAVEFCETKLNLDPAKYDLNSVNRLELTITKRRLQPHQ